MSLLRISTSRLLKLGYQPSEALLINDLVKRVSLDISKNKFMNGDIEKFKRCFPINTKQFDVQTHYARQKVVYESLDVYFKTDDYRCHCSHYPMNRDMYVHTTVTSILTNVHWDHCCMHINYNDACLLPSYPMFRLICHPFVTTHEARALCKFKTTFNGASQTEKQQILNQSISVIIDKVSSELTSTFEM